MESAVRAEREAEEEQEGRPRPPPLPPTTHHFVFLPFIAAANTQLAAANTQSRHAATFKFTFIGPVLCLPPSRCLGFLR